MLGGAGRRGRAFYSATPLVQHQRCTKERATELTVCWEWIELALIWWVWGCFGRGRYLEAESRWVVWTMSKLPRAKDPEEIANYKAAKQEKGRSRQSYAMVDADGDGVLDHGVANG